MAARQRGIYVSIMLFGGYVEISEWAGNPFNSQNNINGVDGDFNGAGKDDTQVMPLAAEVDTIQKAYVNKVIDTVADLEIRMNLAAMTPRADLSSTGYVLASPGSEYLVYQPQSGPFTIDLIAGSYAYEWFDAVSGTPVANGVVTIKQGRSSFTPPFAGDAVLYLELSTKSIL